MPAALFRGGVQLGQRLAGVRGPLRSWRAGSLRRLFDSGASLRLQFPKVQPDLGVNTHELLPGISNMTHQNCNVNGILLRVAVA